MSILLQSITLSLNDSSFKFWFRLVTIIPHLLKNLSINALDAFKDSSIMKIVQKLGNYNFFPIQNLFDDVFE